METVDIMKRVNAILQSCRDDPRLRTKIADETAKWVRSKSKTTHDDFMSFLNRLEVKFNIKEVTNERPESIRRPDEHPKTGDRSNPRSIEHYPTTRSASPRNVRRARRPAKGPR